MITILIPLIGLVYIISRAKRKDYPNKETTEEHEVI